MIQWNCLSVDDNLYKASKKHSSIHSIQSYGYKIFILFSHDFYGGTELGKSENAPTPTYDTLKFYWF